jgi:long-chain acyl-CoA synthetase
LNWLPFSHIYARTVDIYVTLFTGATMCLVESQETLVVNLMEIQPTNMSGVPRFYEKVLTAVQDKDPAVMKKKLHAIFGPRIDFLGSGGAPLPLAVAQSYKDMGLLLLQGYGLTESSPVISFNRKDAYKIDSVGLPIPGVEVKIAPDGEVLTRGPHVMKGYWKNPQATVEAVKDGWLHTGDLGRIDEDGYLYINGRKKDLLVLSNGKKVVPSHIESILLGDPCIDQVVVCGEGKSFLTALIVPHWANLTQALGVNGQPAASDPNVRTFLEKRIEQALKCVAAWEQVKKIAVLEQPFSVANEELTISLKLKRNVIFEHHRAALETMYCE